MGHSLARMGITTALAVAFALPAPAASTAWKLDPNHSSAQFSVRHLGLSTVRGAFSSVNGSVTFDDKDVSKSTVDVTIDVNSVDTRQPDRDKDLKSDKFFDVANHPNITFKSTKVEQVSPGKLKVTG